MSGDPNKLYSVPKTMMWFAIASIALLVSLFLMTFQDYEREWKSWQRKFVALERDKVKKELEQVKAKMDPKTLEALQADRKKAEEEFQRNKGEYQDLEKEKAKSSVELVQITMRYQDLKQFYDSYKYFLEEYREKKEQEHVKEYEEKLTKLEPELHEAKLKQEEAEKKVEEVERKIGAMKANEKEIEKKINQMLREEQQLGRRLKKLDPKGIDKAAQELLNAPMLDFIAPSLQIQQVVLEDLHDDLYFAKAQKVDRCTTCHLAIDRKGFEDAPQPFRTHPNPDLFLSAGSAHPLEKIGCTVCHGGNGHSLSFVYTAHTPRNEGQQKEWEKKYHWHELEKWEAKMLPLEHTEASCTKCHTGAMEIPQAPRLNLGRELAQTSGCFGCHTVKGFENRWKIGPDLKHIQSKVDREWMIRWLHDPKAFRPSTQMPQIFNLDNTNSPDDRKKSDIAIEGIAAYLLKHSTPVELKSPPAEGDPEIGKKLISEVGCFGCHSLGETQANHHGPELNSLGSKVDRDWLYTWLKDPKHFSSDTRMPNLRLSDEEAGHITSFLLQSRNDTFEQQPVPSVSEKELDEFALDYMSGKMRRSEALEQLKGMGLQQKFEFVGREIILQQGCFGCHLIEGFETAKPIGTELTKEGQKEVDKLDFGFIDIERTRQAWFFQKLKNPRIFDRDKVKGYHEKLRMPQFNFTDSEAEALTTFLLSLREEDIPLEMQKQLNLHEQEIEAGRFLTAKLNCYGCHTVDGHEGQIRALYEDLGNAPPVLDGEGAKVREEWLFRFLHGPSTIRPWLKIRMPTFGFTDEETNTLIKYFSNLAGEKVSFAPEPGAPTPEMINVGRDLFTKFRCIQCHLPSAAQGLTASFLAPDLVLTKDRLKPAWVVEWLKDPQVLQPGTMMPTFFSEGTTPFTDVLDGDAMKQIHAIAAYLMAFTPEEAAQVRPPAPVKK